VKQKMNEQVSSQKRSRESDGKVRRYVAHVYTKAVENGIQVVYASLWLGSQDFRSLEGMADEVYANEREIRDAVEELADTKNVSIEFLPAIDFN
jgi:hypothetical protein